MKDTIKIAVGVFSGLIAALALALLVRWFPGRIHRWRDEQRGEENISRVYGLTPETLISRCGQPEEDVTGDLGIRELTYFSHQAGPTYTVKVAFVISTADGKPLPPRSLSMMYGDGRDAPPPLWFDLLPCLKPK
jgi:hypothetical protein